MDHFQAQKLNISPQFWAFIQDKRGVVYIANNDGILEFDGVKWRIIIGTYKKEFSSLAIDNYGRIFSGGNNDFGYLEVDSSGKLAFVSLLSFVDENDRDFGDVKTTQCINESVFFITDLKIFKWNRVEIKVWEMKEYLGWAFKIENQLYIWQYKKGLMILHNDSLKLIPDGEIFKEVIVTAMMPHTITNDKITSILIGELRRGLFLYDGKSIKPFKTQADEILINNFLYCGTRLSNGNFALGTFGGGLVVIDQYGKITSLVNKQNGLLDDVIISLYVDIYDGLWIGHETGVSRIELPSPLTRYDDRHGVTGLQPAKKLMHPVTDEAFGLNHCRLAVGRDYDSASPVRGVRTGGGDESMEISVQVQTASQQ